MGELQTRPSSDRPGTALVHGCLLAALPLLSLPAPARTADPVAGVTDAPRAMRRLDFVENLGQWSTPASFVAARGATVVQVGEDGFAVDARPEGAEEPARLRFSFEGARTGVELAGEAVLPGLRNYLKGRDPGGWVRGVRAFERVLYTGLYEGVDLRLRDVDGMPEYDLLLAPGADLSQVVVRCEGVGGLELDAGGGLCMQSAQGVLRQSPPVTWCARPSGELEPVECTFVVLGESRYGFRLAAHDDGLPVVIDPGLEWATYLGGSDDEFITGIARKPNGDIVVVGVTLSLDFPPNPPGLATWGFTDAFVAILDPTGSTLLSSALLGGDGQDNGFDVQVGPAGEVYVVGNTDSDSTTFPVTGSAYQSTLAGSSDGFLVELSPDLGSVVYCSYVGGSSFELVTGVHVTAPGVLTLAGQTASSDFPAVTSGTAVQATYAGGSGDYFVCRMDLSQPPASQLSYGTFLGGTGKEGKSATNLGLGASTLKSPDLHVDGAGRVTLAGRTSSADAPVTPNAWQPGFDGYQDGYLARIDPSLGAAGLVYATYLHGTTGHQDVAFSLDVDAAGVITVGGQTFSPTFPVTPGAYQVTHASVGSWEDAFILRLDPSQPAGSQLVYGTFLGGDGTDKVLELRLDSQGRILAAGHSRTQSGAGFPTTCAALQTQPGSLGIYDGFIAYLDPAGNGPADLLYSTLVGGAQEDGLPGGLLVLSEAPTLKILASGSSESIDFPTTAGAYQAVAGGAYDGVLLQFELDLGTCVSSYCTAGSSASGCTATLSASGLASASAPSGFVVAASGVEGAKDGLFFFGTNGRQASPWGNGTSYQCVAPPVKRAGLLTGGGAVGLCDGTFAQDLNALWCPGCVKPGHNPGAGAVVQAQLWYRDPQNTSNQTTSLSDAIEFAVGP